MSRDLVNRYSWEQVADPTTSTSAVTSTGVSMAGYAELMFMVSYGESSDTLGSTVYWTAKVQKSTALGSGYTDCGATELILTTGTSTSNAFALINASTEDDECYVAGVKIDPDYDYYRVIVTPTGTHTYGTPVAVYAVRGGGNTCPPSGNLSTPA